MCRTAHVPEWRAVQRFGPGQRWSPRSLRRSEPFAGVRPHRPAPRRAKRMHAGWAMLRHTMRRPPGRGPSSSRPTRRPLPVARRRPLIPKVGYPVLRELRSGSRELHHQRRGARDPFRRPLWRWVDSDGGNTKRPLRRRSARSAAMRQPSLCRSDSPTVPGGSECRARQATSCRPPCAPGADTGSFARSPRSWPPAPCFPPPR